MIYEPNVRNYLKLADEVPSQHQIIAEWNMNRYQKISEYGLYKGSANSAGVITSYSLGDTTNKTNGDLYNIYDDGTVEVDADNNIFSSISSVFEADRPNPGIVLTTFISNSLISSNTTSMRVSKLSTGSARFYPFSKNRTYDYFNSARLIDKDGITDGNRVRSRMGISTSLTGGINNVNPFVAYSSSFVCNKIVVKVQNHNTVPDRYFIDILNTSNTWVNVYSGNTAAGFVDGTLEIYYDGTQVGNEWSQTVNRLTDLDEISTPNVQLKVIKGIRFRVASLSTVIKSGKYYNGSLELIEISPRIEADLTNYTESFSISESIGDSEFGLPVGSLVTSNGSILISNETSEFLLSSAAADYKLLNPDVEFRIYQKITVPGTPDVTYTIPLKVMYADQWSVKPDFTAEISVSDKMRMMQEKNVTDMSLVSNDGVPFSAIILMLLDNSGITGYEFKTFDTVNPANEDTKIKTFYCKKEETVAQVLEKIAVATQSAMYFDAYNNLNVLTKERITGTISRDSDSTDTTRGVDYWLVYDEDYAGQEESSKLSGSYVANVISSNDSRIDPITNGTITYHSYGVKRTPGAALTNFAISKEFIDDIPYHIGTSYGYDPVLSILWQPQDDQKATLGAGTLIRTLSNDRLDDVFTTSISASNQQHAIYKMYSNSNANQKSALFIEVDRSDILTFLDYKGFVMIDQEIIAYNGKVFSVNGQEKILFSKEDLDQEINNLAASARNSSIVQIGFIVEPRFEVTGYNTGDKNLYNYTVISDGRGQFGTKVQEHSRDISAFLVNGITSLTLGGAYTNKAPNENQTSISTRYDYKDVTSFKKAKRLLGISDNSEFNSYIGLMKLSGPKEQLADRGSQTNSNTVANQNKINQIVDQKITGDFDPYIYSQGERNIYIKEVNEFGFRPDVVATRMKLFSGRKQKKNGKVDYSTNSAIGGIGFALKKDNDGNIISGYFLEIESVGSAAQTFDKKSKSRLKNSIRFYRVSRDSNNKLQPTLIGVADAKIVTDVNELFRYIEDQERDTDVVVDLEIRIDTKDGKSQFNIYYGGKKISFNEDPLKDDISENGNIWGDTPTVFFFVRNDSQAQYEYLMLAQKPSGISTSNEYFSVREKTEIVKDYEKYLNGSVNPRIQDFFKKKLVKKRYYDFGRTVREVRKYDIRYKDAPSLSSKIIDVSSVNPKYFIYGQPYFTSFGGELIVANATKEPIALDSNSTLPLYITGTKIEELSTGNVNLIDFYQKIEKDGRKISNLSYNKSVYGEKTFNLDSSLIQNTDHANKLLQWIIENCSRERLSISMEIFVNPLLELGDKVKIFSKSRGYVANNLNFGEKTFVVSEIQHSVDQSSKKMMIKIVEVGGI